ncbi:MAG: hypothetical protein LBL73_01920 [Synergistaceae bacterium]|nr:hypothetical protein [Synergistaceae bacterium]
MALDKSKIRRNLKRKGFRERQSDHLYLNYETSDGKLSDISTKISHGSAKDIGDSLVSEMARQCRIKKTEFVDLINCSLSRKQYEKILEKLGEI